MQNNWLTKHRLRWIDLPGSFKDEFIKHQDMQPPYNRVSSVVFDNILIKKFGFESAETILGERWGTFYLDDRDYTYFKLRWS